MNREDREMALKILRGARDLLVDKGWVQGRLAEDKDGQPVPPWDPDACRFCALGALRFSFENSSRPDSFDRARCLKAFDSAELSLIESLPHDPNDLCGDYGSYNDSLIAYNDLEKTTKKDILTLFDRAIEFEKWKIATEKSLEKHFEKWKIVTEKSLEKNKVVLEELAKK